MKTGRRIIFWFVLVTLVLLTFWVGFYRKTVEKVANDKTVPVEVETVATGSLEETLELTGWIKANSVVDITSKVPGRIESLRVAGISGESLAVEEGLEVTKGRQLAVIDHDVYLAQVAAAQADVRAKEVELADAEREKKRIIALHESGSGTEQSRDKAVTAADLAAARLAMAKANLELAQINLRESTIISPIDGIVTAKFIDEGNLIRAGDRIATIADMKTVKVIVALAEKYGRKIAVEMPAKIKVDTFGEKEFDAQVYSIHPALDGQTNTIQVEMRIRNDNLLLKPGMFARVSLITSHKDRVVVIARDVILGGKIDKHYVYVVENASERKVARKRVVEIGIIQADRCEIVEGLKPGETLVVNGMNFLADGIPVEVVRLEDIK
ncbi:MAG TPA: efflux RND transporter periplasmic adaptor subunit [Sedimentisphaerales bacterium]|nr:efflux RND transporter periplasmic adaptor subunit [Sedimentisphaerales bacterium]